MCNKDPEILLSISSFQLMNELLHVYKKKLFSVEFDVEPSLKILLQKTQFG